MQKLTKQLTALLVIAVLLLIPFGASVFAQTQYNHQCHALTAEKMVADFVFARPLGIVATTLSSAFFVLSLPFSALGRNADEAYEKLVKEPAKFTFKRKLGNFQ